MTFYFNRETGQRVSKSTWTRSRSQLAGKPGNYVRRSVSRGKSLQPEKSEGTSVKTGVAESSAKGSISPAKTPTTWQEYSKEANAKLARKLRKRQMQEDMDDYDRGLEYETGVDY